MPIPDQIVHYTDTTHLKEIPFGTDVEHMEGDASMPAVHIDSAMCWCEPERRRFNALSSSWERWDRDGLEWVIVEGQETPATISEPVRLPPVIAPRRPADELADRAAMRAEDEFWRGVD